MDELDKVPDLIRRRQFAGALEILLRAWDADRDPGLGQVIESLSPLISRDPIIGKTRAIRLRKWRELADDGDDADVPRLLDCLSTFARAQLLECFRDMDEWRPDPRLASLGCDWLANPPDGVAGLAALPFWQLVLEVVEQHADARHVEALADIRDEAENSRDTVSEFLTEKLPASLARTAHLEAPENPIDTSEIRRAIAVHDVPTDTRQAIDELFAAVYADPDADEPRAVLADVLTEQDDPRGEFIVLQLLDPSDLTAEQKRRERQLIAGYGRKWLGALEPFTRRTGVVFERGFPAAIRLAHGYDNQTRLADMPEAQTLGSIELLWYMDQRSIAPLLPRLHTVRRASAALLRDSHFPITRELGAFSLSGSDISLLVSSRLPKLRKLVLQNSVTAFHEVERVWAEGMVGRSLDELVVMAEPYRGVRLASWLDNLSPSIPIPKIAVSYGSSAPFIELEGKGMRCRPEGGPRSLSCDLSWLETLVVAKTQRIDSRWKQLFATHVKDLGLRDGALSFE